KVPFLYRRRDLDSGHTRGFWGRVARTVMGRPVVSGLAAAAILIAAALPVFGIKTGFSGVSTYPNDVQSKRAFTVLSRDFSGGLAEPAQIVVDGDVTSPAVKSAIKALQVSLSQDPMFGPSEVQANKAGNLALVSVPVNADPASPPAYDAIRHLRDDLIPQAFGGVNVRVLVGGQTAVAV